MKQASHQPAPLNLHRTQNTTRILEELVSERVASAPAQTQQREPAP